MRGLLQRTTGFSLRTKMLLLVGITATVLLVLLYALSHLILVKSFAHLEQDEVAQDTRRVINTLHSDTAELNRITVDWAQRDDTYRFIEDHNTAYIESNLSDRTFETFDFTVMLFIDSSDKLVYGKVFNRDTNQAIILTPALTGRYLSGGSLLSRYAYLDIGKYQDGLVATPYGPLLIAIHPIRRSDGTGDPHGMLIIGRYLDEARLKQFAQLPDVQLRIQYVADPALPADLKTAVEKLSTVSDVWVQALGSRTFGGYALLNDISGQPLLVLSVQTPRDISDRGEKPSGFSCWLPRFSPRA